MSRLAIFRVEGPLLRTSSTACAAWMAARQQDVLGRFARVAATLTASPLAALGAVGDAHLPSRALWWGLRGCSEDRLVVLGEDWWSQIAQKSWNPAGERMIDRCHAAGDRIVLVTALPHTAITGLRERTGAVEVLANTLDLHEGRATGDLVPPVRTGRVDGGFVAKLARLHGVEATGCAGYGSHAEDATLLSGVGRPCAVTPDAALRRLAVELQWPVVEA